MRLMQFKSGVVCEYVESVVQVTHVDVYRILSQDEGYRTNPDAVSTDALVVGRRPHPGEQ